MKAIQAENYGCTDLSQVELEQTKGGGYVVALRYLIPLAAAAGAAVAKLWDYIANTKANLSGPKSQTNQVTVVTISPTGATTNITTSVNNSGFYWEIEHEPK